MSWIEVVAARQEHISPLALAMRQAEQDEVAALGYTPLLALNTCVRYAALAWTGLVDGVPVCMFGATPKLWPVSMLDDVGEAWLLSTDGILAHRMAFLRRNKVYVAQMLERFPTLEGMVHARNGVSIRWLMWLGFWVGPAEPWGKASEMFHPFLKTAT